ncbi:MAG TPA: beta-ketoacyl synthase N-terminal-like domain-containing protein, partial [Gemmatimonadaceae bacterium]|nr:beta-ketoacyl synthase N-terminal-like domain-containing protein [Gemmatimonadaceae bacterium]
MTLPAEQRVVVTGIGAVTPIGLGAAAFWEALLAGRGGAAPITHFDASGFDTTFACEVKDFDARAVLDRKLANRLDPVCHFALAAADEALRDAALEPARMSDAERERAGVIFGTGIGGIQTFQEQAENFVRHGPRRISPFF